MKKGKVVVTQRRAFSKEWQEVGHVTHEEVPGSLEDKLGRLLFFGWIDSHGPAVWEMKDAQSRINGIFRELDAGDKTRIHDLAKAPFESVVMKNGEEIAVTITYRRR